MLNLEPYPLEISDLMLQNTAQGKHFRAKFRQFNSAFSLASIGANINPPPGRDLFASDYVVKSFVALVAFTQRH